MKSLYDKNPQNWDKIAEFGYPEFREVAKKFARYLDMDEALGMLKCSRRWGAGISVPSRQASAVAKAFLEKHKAEAKPQAKTQNSEVSANPMVIVSGPKQALKKLEGIAKMLGCETVEI